MFLGWLEGKLILVVSGQGYVDGRLSNWIEYKEVKKDNTLGRLKCGYGYLSVKPYRGHRKVQVTIGGFNCL